MIFVGKFGHFSFRVVLIRIHPRIVFVEPNFIITVFAPRRCGRLLDLNRQAGIEKIAGRNGADLIAFVVKFAECKIQKLRTFKPPMPVKFGIVRRGYERRMSAESFAQFICLSDAFADEIGGIFGGFRLR